MILINIQSFTDDDWTSIDRTATCSLFWDEFSFGINHRDHHALFIARFNGLVWLDRGYIIIGFDNQVHSTFDTLTDSFNLPAVPLPEGLAEEA